MKVFRLVSANYVKLVASNMKPPCYGRCTELDIFPKFRVRRVLQCEGYGLEA